MTEWAGTRMAGETGFGDDVGVEPRSLHCATAKGAVASVGMTVKKAGRAPGRGKRNPKTQAHTPCLGHPKCLLMDERAEGLLAGGEAFQLGGGLRLVVLGSG